MTTFITQGESIILPSVVDGYEAENEQNTIVHPILGSSNPDVTERPASLRTGTLRLVFGDPGPSSPIYGIVDGLVVALDAPTLSAEQASAEAVTLHNAGGVFTFQSDERDSIAMTYVPVGRARRTLDDTTRDVWIVTLDFQELTA